MAQTRPQSSAEVPAPNDVVSKFQNVGGLPANIICELFTRANVDPAVQAKFWQQARAKEFATIAGRVGYIKTNRDGTAQVAIESTATGGAPRPGEPTPLTNYFYFPDDLTQDQLDELKRAQSGGFCVELEFQLEDGARPVNSVRVFPCPQ